MPQGVNIPVNLQVNSAGTVAQLAAVDAASQKAAAAIKAAFKAATAAPDPQLQNILTLLKQYQPHQISAAFGPAMAQNLSILQQRQGQISKAVQNGYQVPTYRGPQPGTTPNTGSPAYMNSFYSSMLMAGTGNFRQIGTSIAQGLVAALSNAPGTSYGLGTRLLGAAGVGPASSSFGGGVLGMLGSLGPVGIPLMVGAAAVGVAGIASEKQAQAYRQAALIQANVGGAAGGSGLGLRQMAFDTAHNYRYDPMMGAEVTQTLGLLGAPASGMFDKSGRGGTLGAVFAASRQSQMDPQTIAQYFGAQMGAGGQSLTSVIKSFRTLEEQSAKTKIPLDRLIEETQRFGQATGGAVPNMVALAGIQSVLGPGISAGGLIAPLSNATGADAYKAAALLGIPVSKLQSLQFGGANHQGNQAELLDLLSAETKKITAGKNPAQARTLAETFLNNTQLLDTSSLSAYKYSSLIDKMIYGSSKQFQKAAQGVGQGTKFGSTEDWENQMLSASDNQTSLLDQLGQDLTAVLTNLSMMLPDLNHIARGIEDLVQHFDPGQWLKDFSRLFTGGDTSPGGGPTKTAAGSYLGTDYTVPAAYGAHGIPHAANASDALPPGNHNGGFVSADAFNSFGVVPNVNGSKNKMPMWQWNMIQQAARKQGIDPFLMAAQVGQESSFNPMKVNGNHYGLGQFDPQTAEMVARELGMKKYDLFNPAQNLALMARYDKDLYKGTGNWADTMDAYGTGSGVLKVQMELGGKIQVVDANGKVYGYVDANTLVGTTKATVHRAPVASRHPAPNPHGGGHHSQ